MFRIEKILSDMAYRANWVSAGAVIIIMLVTTLDVVLRIFNISVPGAYDLAGLMGSLIVSFSLAYTALERGHIAVEFLTDKFPQRYQEIIFMVNDFISAILFMIISWRSFLYARDLALSGEVSLTLQMPTYPFAYGISISAALLCMILLIRSWRCFWGHESL